MKMTYLRPNNRRKQGRGKAVLAVTIFIIIFTTNYFFPRTLPTIFYPVTSVFLRSESSFFGFFRTIGNIVRSKYDLVKDNEKLTSEIASRDRSIIMIGSLKTENENLKNVLSRSGKGDFVLASVLSRPPVSIYDTLVIDIGSNAGIKVGNRVYVEGDILIGDVSEVFSDESKISLFSTPGRVTSVLVGTTTIATKATGRGGLNFVITLPAGTKVVQGSTIKLSGMHPHTFGVVDDISLDSTGSIQKILFKSPVNINQLDFVEVERK